MSSSPAIQPRVEIHPAGGVPNGAPKEAIIESKPAAHESPPADSAQPVTIRVRNVGKCYHIYDRPQDRLKQALLRFTGKRFFREFWALRNVSLELRRGEAVGILGRNGSGKSTLLQVIAGTLAPTTGGVEVAGRVAALLELGSGFNPEFTGRENVYLNGAILGLSREQIDQRFDAIASFADIGQFLDQPVKTYSSGMLVRLAFAVQVQVEPDILIVDEALAVGDALFQKRCFQRIDELRAKGVTLLFVSHDQESVRTLTDRAILLDQGEVRAAGPSGDVLLEYRKLLHEDEKRWHAWTLKGASDRAAAKTATPQPPSQPAPESERVRDMSFGDLDAQIESVQVLDGAGNATSLFYPGDTLRIVVTAVLRTELEHVNVAVRLRNKQGVKMTSWGVLNDEIRRWHAGEPGILWDRKLPAGTRVRAEFVCDCPLGSDLYEVQATVTQERDRFYRAQRILHWRDEAAFFQVAQRWQEYNFGGVCDLRLRTSVTVTPPPPGAAG